jgi:hypothetical protein
MNAQQQNAVDYIKTLVKPNDTVFTVLRHVSASGMNRWIDFYVMQDNEPMRLTYQVALALGEKYDTKRNALKIGGCGMDMGFQAVYCLGATLWPFGTEEPHGTRNGEPDSTGGYALNQRWM